MFDSAQAFTRYRLEVARSWPDGEAKDKLLAAIECSLRQERRHKATSSVTIRDRVAHDARFDSPDQD
jgi:hypothetical protein